MNVLNLLVGRVLRVSPPNIAVVLFFVSLSGCSWQDPLPSKTPLSPALDLHRLESPSGTPISARLLEHFKSWEGVPYRYGGQTRSGVDCSAFVQQSFKAIMDIDLPRTTAQQMRSGIAVSEEQTRAGDMLFFRTGRAVHHVGIYLDADRFMHASKSQGVALARLDDRYWQSRLIQIRRIVRDGE